MEAETSSSNLHHPELYFPDGNFVIIAQDPIEKTSPMYFRVHQSILSKHSQVFKDMFSLPGPPPDSRDFYDGVPCVEVSDDPKDMAKFLTILYEPLIPLIAKDEPDAAFKMFGVLKLADKFMVEALKEIILSHIRLDWPKSLLEWDRRQEEYRSRCLSSFEQDPTHTWAPDPASVIQVARSYDPTLLPLVFFRLSTLRRMTYLEHGQPCRYHPTCDMFATARWSLLSAQDERCLERGRLAMLLWIVQEFDDPYFEDWSCPKLGDCDIHIKIWLIELHRCILRNPDPLVMLEIMTSIGDDEVDGYWRGETPDDICEGCHAKWRSSIPPIRSRLFESLGSFFPKE